ncbi:hypothetical protein RHGRI_033886 [Rhododendron griersonianum]|uniref:DNA (cytosine-5-)-methyltransferase n=1 Tax=Rhododendron griersonianum TaxID=479676 RepID=A0AAV6I1Q8_9ERIC|nr:hypothetical protein RHGRI_033886 [Rhododendron griersonianum]
MDIVKFLKPRFVLMENVVNIFKLARGVLASYTVARLVCMDYQSRVGILAAGSFGVPQCRMRVYLWRPCWAETQADACLLALSARLEVLWRPCNLRCLLDLAVPNI